MNYEVVSLDIFNETRSDVDMINHDDDYEQVEQLQELESLFPRKEIVDTSSLDVFNEMRSEIFHPNQVESSKQIIGNFSKTHLVLLFAQMQSGKTGTFLCTACAMLHLELVKKVYIISGVANKELHQQLVESIETYTTYFDSVMETNITGKIVAVKSSELDALHIENDVLVVWDEAHYAQDTINRPYKMFRQNNNLPVDGTKATNELWKNKKCYLLTVSATPFSEYVDCKDQCFEIVKEVVRMKPGTGYRGVEYYHKNKYVSNSWNIMKDVNGVEKFNEILRESKIADKPQYAILRFSGNVLTDHHTHVQGWKVIMYDMKNKADLPYGWKTLNNAPTEDTLIILKGMGRIGQVIPKKHIAFVFEYSGCKTDTTLQSLIGRMCGYGPFNPSGTNIYIHMNEVKSQDEDEEDEPTENNFEVDYHKQLRREQMSKTEIQRYINHDIPLHAKNIISKKKSEAVTVYYSTVPLKITVSTDRSDASAHQPIQEAARIMNRKNGSKKLTNSLKLQVIDYIIEIMHANPNAFGDTVQRDEIFKLLECAKEGNIGEIINFGDLNSAKSNKLNLRTEMHQSLIYSMPYRSLVNDKKMREKGTKIQLLICSPDNGVVNEGIKDFNTTSTLYFTGYTNDAEQLTKYNHNKQNMPSTTKFEAFHPNHISAPYKHSASGSNATESGVPDLDGDSDTVVTADPCADPCDLSTHSDSESYMRGHTTHIYSKLMLLQLLCAKHCKGTKVRVTISNKLEKIEADKYIQRLDSLCLSNNGKFIVERVRSRRTKEEQTDSLVERYWIYYHETTRILRLAVQ